MVVLVSRGSARILHRLGVGWFIGLDVGKVQHNIACSASAGAVSTAHRCPE